MSKGTILVVEDTLESLKLLSDILTVEGYRVLPANSGELALASIATTRPELVLLDIRMPGMDGFEVIRRLKARDECRHVPVIFLSAADEIKPRVEGFRLGAVDYIAKPYRSEELLARVRTHLELFHMRADLERQAAELRQSLRDMESFSYSTSHDLRTPLRAINGFAEILIRSENLSDEGKRLLDRIAQAAVRLGRLIDDVLEYSRVGRAQMKHEPVDLNLLCRAVADELQPLYPQVRIDLAPLPGVNGDSAMLRQVLQNLIENACKFTAAAADSRVEVGVTNGTVEQAFYVKDNGVGFEMDYADKLFRMFERLHTEEQYAGSGVGLAIAKRLIERHGGRIWAESVPEKGASFFFTLGSERNSDARAKAHTAQKS